MILAIFISKYQNMLKFRKDLIEGQKGERVIAKYLEQNNGLTDIQFNDDIKYDIKGIKDGKELTFEVKTDRYEHFKGYKTFNMFIEQSCGNKPSGINATQADYFIYYYPDFELFYFIKTEDLRKLIQDTDLPIKAQSGDNGKVVGVVIHRNLYKKYFTIKRLPKDNSIWG